MATVGRVSGHVRARRKGLKGGKGTPEYLPPVENVV